LRWIVKFFFFWLRMAEIPGATIGTGENTRFAPRGYAVYKLDLTQQTIEELKRIADGKKTEAIFNQRVAPNTILEAKENDKKRLMSKPFFPTNIQKNKCLKLLWKELEVIAKFHNCEWQPFKLVVLRSEAGCSKQETHTDGTADNPEIGGVLIAVEDETFFEINERKLVLRAGEAVAFHGNTPHSGAAYEKNNVRFHVYLAKKKGDVPTDEVGKFDRVCDQCHRGFNSSSEKKNHTCKAQAPEKIELKKRRKRDNKRDERERKRNATLCKK
jgi:hypothetical protein